ncbi:beta-lactamase domain protein [Desulfovibrio sp. X2]|uniref:MBL fold metallo-hydrolase n=1 Tax=Desulfovibrio sp. X2 TaxID=941449 RepID=UPI00035875D7|nr:MBL fold metallo-hydrolase [Desulfovibrio sp. X2]EPR42341.1 beta-lactamase domain protein [Desulfovibrio sp. X2]
MTTVSLHVLSDNRALPGFFSEWGFALALEARGETWLWDAGAGPAFLDNAKRLGVHPESARGLALSHGHFDHGGGLEALCAAGFDGPVHAHPECLRERWALRPGEEPESIGISGKSAVRLARRLAPVHGNQELTPWLEMLTDIERLPGNPQSVQNFFLDARGREPDDVPDDALLLLRTAAGPVAVLGCCHSGLANSLSRLRRAGVGRLYALVGGMHLYQAAPDAVDAAVSALAELGVERILPGHCTGDAATGILSRAFPGRVEPLAAGMSVRFGAPL